MNKIFSFLFMGLLPLSLSAVEPAEALGRLIEGNVRFMTDKSTCPSRGKETREAAAKGQAPFAVILACSDSRASPEIVFDQGVGDLFVVRVAGNVIDPMGLESIEYGVDHLGARLIMVLGHQSCGAVSAVWGGNDYDIRTIAGMIQPAIAIAKKEKDASIETAIKQNVLQMVKYISADSRIKALIDSKKAVVVGAYYNLATAKVEIISTLATTQN